MAAVDLPAPGRGGGTAAMPPAPAGAFPAASGFPVDGLSVGGFSLRVFDAGLACCAVEVSAALRRWAELLPGDGSGAAGSGTGGPGTGGPGTGGPGTGSSGGSGTGGSGTGSSGTDGAPGPVNVLVVAGTVTDKLAPLVLAAYRDLPEPRRVLSFGACSNSGGPYWDSYCVTKGADQIVPVDVYVPGCPPRPEALIHGLRLLRDSGDGDAGGEQR
jgi:hypothetical protein